MKKQKLKNYLKFRILLFGISIILTNCQKDDDFESSNLSTSKPIPTVKTINFNEFLNQKTSRITLEKLNKLNNKSSKTSSNNNNNNNNNNNKDSDGQPQTITIDSTSIKQIIKDGTTSYTFKIVQDSINNTFFENLIIQTDSLQETNAYVIKYIPETDYDINNPFQGVREITPIDSNLNINTSNSKTTFCVTVITYVNHYLCDPGVEQTPENCDLQYTVELYDTTCNNTGGGGGYNNTGTYTIPSGTSSGGGGGSSSNYTDIQGNGNNNLPVITSPNYSPTNSNPKKLKILTQHPQIKAKIIVLKAKTSENREYGYQFNVTGNNPITYNPVEGELASDNQGNKFPPASVFTQLEIHTHYDGLDNAFSASDIYKATKLGITNPNAPAILVAPNGKLYALMVTDQAKAQVFLNYNNQVGEEGMNGYYNLAVIKVANNKCGGTCTDPEYDTYLNQALVQYLGSTQWDAGLTLYEATEDGNGIITWSPVTITP